MTYSRADDAEVEAEWDEEEEEMEEMEEWEEIDVDDEDEDLWIDEDEF